MSYSSTVLAESSLVSYWQLAETSGTSAADSKGTNTGTYTGGYTLAQTPPGLSGQVSGAVLLNGTTGCIVDGSPAGLNLNRNFSLECWFKLTAGATTTGGLISHGYQSYYLRAAYVSGTNFNLQALQSNVGGLLGSSTNLTPGNWYYAVCTVDAAGAVKLYINGVLDASGTMSATLSATYSVTLGRDTNGSGVAIEFLNGTLSNCAIYNTALSAAQVTAHYNAASLTTARVSQEGLLVVGQASTTARVSQEGALVVTQAAAKARVSQLGALVIVPTPVAAAVSIPASFRVKRGSSPTTTLQDGQLGWNRTTKRLWIGDTGTNQPVYTITTADLPTGTAGYVLTGTGGTAPGYQAPVTSNTVVA